MTLLDLCSYLGLAAAGGAALNLLLGLLISLRYSPVRYWPHLRLNLFAFHQWTAYGTILLALSHPVVLLFLDKPHFRAFDVLLPIQSPLQPLINVAGGGALYLLLLVFVTSLLRTRLGRPIWRRIHYLVFPAAMLLFVHSILTDPDLKDGHPHTCLRGVPASLRTARAATRLSTYPLLRIPRQPQTSPHAATLPHFAPPGSASRNTAPREAFAVEVSALPWTHASR